MSLRATGRSVAIRRCEQSEGIFFAPRDDTGIIAFVLIISCGLNIKSCFAIYRSCKKNHVLYKIKMVS